jgi:hypothetical protein
MTETPRGPRRSGRAAERQSFVAARAGEYDDQALAAAMAERRERELADQGRDRVEAEALPPRDRAFAVGDVRRWVPIGPSVIRAKRNPPWPAPWPRATGRVRDIAVSSDGLRAYAATAKGGLWYTGDGGALWSPVGGWAERAGTAGGVHNAQACGSLLVFFPTPPGTTPADDFVMVGTGELQGFGRPPARPALAGRGILAAKGPALTAGAGGDPWEPEAGIGVLEGLGIFEMARDPAAVAGNPTAPGLDRVVAATSGGLFLGTRQPAPAPHNGEFTWARLSGLGTFMGLPGGRQPLVTDVLWLPRGVDPRGRILVTVARDLETANPTVFASIGSGLAFSDNLGGSFQWVTNLSPAARIVGRMSLANAEGTDRVYVLGDVQPGAPGTTTAKVWQITGASGAAPSATPVGGVPPVWRRNSLGKNQRDYDQCIAVDVVGGVDRLYLGGNVAGPGASVWCKDVGAGPALGPTTGVSRTGTPPGGEGAAIAGLVGDDVHADVHMIRLAGTAPNRQVWVATDGGVFVSTHAGRVNSFAPRATGLAALEVNFLSSHPTSSHFVAIGTQDNGRHVRIGDVVWEDTMGGDGGGVAIHPNRSDLIVSQYVRAEWDAEPTAPFANPLDQASGTVDFAIDREAVLSAFYSGATAIRQSPVSARLAVGTNRVWLTDDLATVAPNTWNVLPYPGPAAVANPRAGGGDLLADRGVGVPGGPPMAPVAGGTGPLGEVITAKWVRPTVILVLFANGVVRWTQDPITTHWSARVLVARRGVTLAPAVAAAPDPAVSMLTDLAPVGTTDDFYLATAPRLGVAGLDTCLFFHDASSRFYRTTLRTQLPPLDPAYAAVVDPEAPTDVYVGTVTGVWRGVRGAGPPAAGLPWPHTWTTDVNGLPQAAVQDLGIWVDPAGAVDSPRLLRAAIQSRGVWERDLKAASEPKRTYLRVHARDDRRRFPTPMKDPRLPPAAPDVVPFSSPDITIRPRWPLTTAPTWRLAAGDTINAGNVWKYQLWTFQTAFRWIYPSVQADGRWSPSLAALVEFHRSTDPALGPVEPKINQALWNHVVGKRLDAAGRISPNPAHSLAVYRPPWQSPQALTAVATEIDLLETVVMRNAGPNVVQVFREPSRVDVLIHHRDTIVLPAGSAFAILLWRFGPSEATLLATDVSPIPGYVTTVLGGGPVPPVPAGWRRELVAGSPRIPLPVPLDARMPRAVPIDVDLSVVPDGESVLFLAITGSTADPCSVPPAGLPATPRPADLVRRWPYAALRLARVDAR